MATAPPLTLKLSAAVSETAPVRSAAHDSAIAAVYEQPPVPPVVVQSVALCVTSPVSVTPAQAPAICATQMPATKLHALIALQPSAVASREHVLAYVAVHVAAAHEPRPGAQVATARPAFRGCRPEREELPALELKAQPHRLPSHRRQPILGSGPGQLLPRAVPA